MHLFGGTSCVFIGCTIQLWIHCAHVHCRVHAKRIAHAHRALRMRIVHALSRDFCSILDSIIEGHFGQILLDESSIRCIDDSGKKLDSCASIRFSRWIVTSLIIIISVVSILEFPISIDIDISSCQYLENGLDISNFSISLDICRYLGFLEKWRFFHT